MAVFPRILLSILFFAPMGGLAGFLIYLMITYYDWMWSNFVGPTLIIPTFMLAVYSLSILFQSSRMINQQGLKVTIKEQLIIPWTRHIPIGMLGMLAFWSWIQGVSLSASMATEGLFPENLGFLLGFLMFINEFFKLQGRETALSTFLQKQQEEGESYQANLRLSVQRLHVVNYLQSIAYLLLTWGLAVIGFFILFQLLGPYLSPYISMMLCLGWLIAVFVIMQKQEKRWEGMARDRNWVP